ncbi:hypothetical protein ACI65C_010404, partial [Semiaphis heraclei]
KIYSNLSAVIITPLPLPFELARRQVIQTASQSEASHIERNNGDPTAVPIIDARIVFGRKSPRASGTVQEIPPFRQAEIIS